MVDLLVDEEARQEDSSTGVCMEYFLKNGILHFLVNVSEKSDYPVGMRSETIRTVASMIDLLDDRFLVQHAVHKPTIRLLRFCVLDEHQSDLYDEDLVDLMYIICSKIHGFPALLNIFFHDRQWLTTPQKAQHTPSSTTSDQVQPLENPLSLNNSSQRNGQGDKKPDYEFVLFTYLLRFVHREGRSGDFARTGLLFLMEMATGQLGDFILESDFATIMAAGLGALYSQLPRKLVVTEEAELSSSSSTYLLASDPDTLGMPFGIDIETSNSSDFRSRLDSFLKLLEFCQDVLTRCPSAEISVSLLQNIRSIFLENILYPSILECSDMDGSAVAVISYIDMILQTLQQDELVDVVVGFLMAVDDNQGELRLSSPQIERASLLPDGKQPADIYVGIEGDKVKSSPYFTALGRFTLKDLIFSRLKSSSQPTVIATLKLLRTLISQHCRYSLRLLSIQLDEAATSFPPTVYFNEHGGVDGLNGSKTTATTISHHNREIELFFSLICSIDFKHSQDILSLGYEAYLSDAETTIFNDCCYQNATSVDCDATGSNNQRQSKLEKRRSLKYGQRYDDRASRDREASANNKIPNKISQQHLQTMPKHRLKQTDPLLQILLGLLSHFFAQSSELNLALTAVISALAVCPFRSLEGWLAFNEEDRARDVLVLGPEQTSTERQSSRQGNKIRVNDIYAQFDKYPTPVDEDDEDDDRSVDFALERNSINMTGATNFRSFPPIFTLLRTLTQQVDYYRSEITQFDTYLEERRQGLFFGDAFANLTLTPSVSSDTTKLPETPSSSTMSLFFGVGASNKKHATKSKAATNTQPTNAISVNKNSTVKHPATTSAPNSTNAIAQNAGVSETLAAHARKTADIHIQPLFPSNFVVEPRETILDLNDEDEDTFAPKGRNPSQPKRQDKTTEIKLSALLNNVVILEECIKELVALVQVRRSIGIDEILYA
jgi:tRNA threonylcarbamoyladenosine modification (KEOPS) complex  Pcc1 subunit